jgi:hypothetical protein
MSSSKSPLSSQLLPPLPAGRMLSLTSHKKIFIVKLKFKDAQKGTKLSVSSVIVPLIKFPPNSLQSSCDAYCRVLSLPFTAAMSEGTGVAHSLEPPAYAKIMILPGSETVNG